MSEYLKFVIGFTMTENDVKCRIAEIFAKNGLTENKLAGGDIATQKRLNRQLSHGASLTVDTILKILDACPNVSADWLLRGDSNSASVNSSAVGDNNVTNNNTTVNDLDATKCLIRQLEEKDKQINQLLQILATRQNEKNNMT